jgi:hypothetical protein
MLAWSAASGCSLVIVERKSFAGMGTAKCFLEIRSRLPMCEAIVADLKIVPNVHDLDTIDDALQAGKDQAQP